MPEKKPVERARKAKREGKAPTTQAGEFVREEMEHIRQGKHGARSPQQAIAIGLSKARRAGVQLPPPRKGTASEQTREKAEHDLEVGRKGWKRTPDSKRSKARRQVLKRESKQSASPQALSKQAKSAAARRRKHGPATPRARRRSGSARSQGPNAWFRG